jgi:hypothetical protein
MSATAAAFSESGHGGPAGTADDARQHARQRRAVGSYWGVVEIFNLAALSMTFGIRHA